MLNKIGALRSKCHLLLLVSLKSSRRLLKIIQKKVCVARVDVHVQWRSGRRSLVRNLVLVILQHVVRFAPVENKLKKVSVCVTAGNVMLVFAGILLTCC